MNELQAINWHDSRGLVWDLLAGPVRLSSDGVKGFGLPEFDDQVVTSALLDGQRRTGFKLKPREVFLPFRFKDAAANDVDGLQREFWRGMNISDSGTLEVIDANGGVRLLGLRIVNDNAKAYKFDPYAVDPDTIGLTMIADQPWWRSELQQTTYRVNLDGGQTFFGNGSGATPFYIASASGSSSFTVNNDGDTDSWVQWIISGGTSSAFRFGVNGHYLGSSMPLGGGDTLVIDTDPTVQTAKLNGNLVPFKSFSELDFAPVPKGVDVTMDIQITGSALVTVQGYSNYERAF